MSGFPDGAVMKTTFNSESQQLAVVNKSTENDGDALAEDSLDNAELDVLTECRNIPEKKITQLAKLMPLVATVLITMMPILILLSLCCCNFFFRVDNHRLGSGIDETIIFSIELADVLHTLNNERDMSALYLSAITPQTKDFLVHQYPESDTAIMKLSQWPIPQNTTAHNWKTKEQFLNALNIHRYTLDTAHTTTKQELNFYNNLITTIVVWFSKALTEATSGSVWKLLVALQEIMDAKESFGIERAYGTIFYVLGGFENVHDYLTFLKAQDIGNTTLYAAREFTEVVDDVYKKTVTGDEAFLGDIEHLRYDIRRESTAERDDIRRESTVERDGSTQLAQYWFNNMTMYLEAILMMQKNLTVQIYKMLQVQEKEGGSQLFILGIPVAFVLCICPIIYSIVSSVSHTNTTSRKKLRDRLVELDKDKKQAKKMKYRALPDPVVVKLSSNILVLPKTFRSVTIMCCSIVGFNRISTGATADSVLELMNIMDEFFDENIKKFDVFKVENNAGYYCIVSGLPNRNGDRHALEVVKLAIALQAGINSQVPAEMPPQKFQLSVGIHTGPVLVSVDCPNNLHYCLFGKPLSIAAALETSGVVGEIQLTDTAQNILRGAEGYSMQQSQVRVKDLPDMEIYSLLQDRS